MVELVVTDACIIIDAVSDLLAEHSRYTGVANAVILRVMATPPLESSTPATPTSAPPPPAKPALSP